MLSFTMDEITTSRLMARHTTAIIEYLRLGKDKKFEDISYFDGILTRIFPTRIGITLKEVIEASPKKLEELKDEFDNRTDTTLFVKLRNKKNEKKTRQPLEIEQFERLYELLGHDSKTKKPILSFSYDDGGTPRPITWSRHHIFEGVGFDTCPYCNRNDILLIRDKASGDTRQSGDMDHWIPKSKYPIFSVSFFNLIPACNNCNDLKSAGTILPANPYDRDSGITNNLRFGFQLLTPSFPRSANSFDLAFTYHWDWATQAQKLEKAKELVRVFRLDDQYHKHLEVVQEIIYKHYVFNKSFRKELFEKYKTTLFSSEDDVFRIAFGRFEDESLLHRRPLSKLIRDIQDQLEGRTSLHFPIDKSELVRVEKEIEELDAELSFWDRLLAWVGISKS